MTDQQLCDIYRKATGIELAGNQRGLEQGHAFVKALFDMLPVADYTPEFEPLYRRPE